MKLINSLTILSSSKLPRFSWFIREHCDCFLYIMLYSYWFTPFYFMHLPLRHLRLCRHAFWLFSLYIAAQSNIFLYFPVFLPFPFLFFCSLFSPYYSRPYITFLCCSDVKPFSISLTFHSFGFWVLIVPFVWFLGIYIFDLFNIRW